MTKNNKILVGGGGGYIGSSLVPILMQNGYDVTVIDVFWFGNYLPSETKIIKKDLFDCTEKDFEGFDTFIYLAGVSNDPMAEFSPKVNFVHNGASPAYLAYLAKRAGVKRYIYASSCSVYGHAEDRLYTEEARPICDYPYGISKLQGERGVRQLENDKFSVIALRQGTVCGYSPKIRMDLLVNTMYKNAVQYGKITVNNPNIWRPVYDIRDAMSAYLLAIEAAPEISGVFNVASGNYTVGEVGQAVKEEMSKLLNKEVELEVKNIYDFRNYRVSVELAKKILGFEPRYSIKDTVNHLHENLAHMRNFDDDKYYNVNIFKKMNLN